MAASPTDLEQRVAALESRRQRADEDANAMLDTIVDTREDTRTLRRDLTSLRLEFEGFKRQLSMVQNDGERTNRKIDALDGKVDAMQRGVAAILAHLGLSIEPDNRDS